MLYRIEVKTWHIGKRQRNSTDTANSSAFVKGPPFPAPTPLPHSASHGSALLPLVLS